jgi:serine O-acetyltransferase
MELHQRLSQTLRRTLESYDQVGGINNVDGLNLPSKRAVGDICEGLVQLLFPGFHDQDPVQSTYRLRSS